MGLINEVLDMARIESGRISLAEEDFSLPELVDNLLTLTKPAIDEHHHQLKVHIEHIEHEAVCGDSLRIQQVFVNLMSNAVKYTPDGGNITLTIKEKPNGFSELGCYEFSIEDNGIGMTPEFQKIMFEPFSRADDHRTTKVQGTGLGMAITRNIVNLGERFEELPMDKFAEHTRAFVKVEDGCNRRCAYCVIPRARGPVRSRDEASVLEELRRLTDAGYKEVVLTAISLPSYGTDSGTSLVELIEKAAEVPGIERIRLGSLDPDMLHDDDIRRMAAVKKLCPQFHLSLQSGCDKTLRAMRRPYTTAQYADIAAKLRAAFGADNVSFTTDVIVGFPGETEDDFEASMAFVTGMRFLKVHVFPYSRREGTAAYDFADQLPEHEKEARSRRMTAAVEEVRAAEAAAMQGRKASVLLETPLSATLFTGYTKQYLPVLVSAPGHKTGDIVEVTLGAWDGKRCRSEIV